MTLENRLAPASSAIWDGGPTGNGTDWLDGINWVANTVPLAGDTVSVGATGSNPVITIGASTSVLRVTSSTRSIVVTGGELTLGAANSNFSSLTLNGGTLGALDGAFLAISTIHGPGAVNITAGRKLIVSGSIINAPLVNNGTLEVIGFNGINGAITANAGSTLRILGGAGTSSARLDVPTGFVNNGAIELTSSVQPSAANLSVGGGTLTNSATGTFSVLAGTGGQRFFNLGGGAQFINQGSVSVSGTDLMVNQSGTGPAFDTSGPIAISSGNRLITGATFNYQGGTISGGGSLDLTNSVANLTAGLTLDANRRMILSNSIVNGPGTLTVAPGGAATDAFSSTITAPLVNNGTLWMRGTSNITGSFAANAGSTLRVRGISNVSATLTVSAGFVNNGAIELLSVNLSATSTLAINGGPITNSATGTITVLPGTGDGRSISLENGADLINQGAINVQSTLNIIQSPNSVVDNAVGGVITMTGGANLVVSSLNNSAGTLAGTGTIVGTVNGTGTIAPGTTSRGILGFTGSLTIPANGTLAIDLAGPTPGVGYDQITIAGTVNITGSTLAVNNTSGSAGGAAFTIIDNDSTDAVVGIFAGLPEGSATVFGGQTFTITYTGGTGNDVVLAHVIQIDEVQVNGGAVQRSRLDSVRFTLNTVAVFATTPEAAFSITRLGGGTVGGFTGATQVVGGRMIITLSNFTGANSDFLSLADGRYTITFLASQVTGPAPLDGNGDFNGPDDFTLNVHRLYGDMTGDARVDIADFGFFSLAYLQSANYNAALDFNNDGRIDIADFGQFSVRYFTSLP